MEVGSGVAHPYNYTLSANMQATNEAVAIFASGTFSPKLNDEKWLTGKYGHNIITVYHEQSFARGKFTDYGLRITDYGLFHLK